MKKSSIVLMLIILLLNASFFSAHSVNAMESTCPVTVNVSATLARGVAELTIYSDVNKTEKAGRLQKGDVCQIAGASGEYYRIKFNGIDGYTPRSKLNLSGMESAAPHPGNVVTNLALEQYFFPSLSKSKTMAIHGTIQADAPIDTLFVLLWDERLQQMEQVVVKEVKNPTAKLNINDVFKNIEFSSMTAGRKTLIIQVASNGKLLDIYRAPVYICGSFKPIRNINDQCRFSAGRNQEKMAGRNWTPSADNSVLTIDLPNDGSAVMMTIEWRFPVESFSVVFLDGNGKIIGKETRTTGFYADTVDFLPETRQVKLSIGGEDNWVRNLCVYDANHPDNAVQKWQPVPEKLDLMLFSPHQDDELLFYGGAIPYACQKGADVAVVYMTNCGRSRYTEALDGLWTAGLHNHPIFMNWRDQWGYSTNRALQTWSENGVDPQMEVVRLIRKYKPEVIIGPDLEGEYGHAQHQVTARLVADAIPLAMDKNYDPKSLQEYGSWEVKKLYLHLYPENQIEMDWDQPFYQNSPISPIFLAKEAFDKHRSQQDFSMDRHGKISNNRIFGLYYSSVGPDEAKNDIFEHIDLQ